MVDLIQHRYGWTDEVIFNLPYARFLDICEVVVAKRQEEVIQGYRYAAFTSFLLSGQEGMTFDKYIETLGIGNNNSKPVRVKKEDALKKADDILALFNQ